MVTLVKHEWHQVDCQYAFELDTDLLSEIYPDLDEDEIAEKLQQLEDGEIDVEDIVNDAYEADVDIDWEHQYDDNWTMRKGGYDVTYELGDENSYHTEPEEPPATHHCTKCRWEGQRWSTRTGYVNEQGEVLPDDCEEWHDTKDVCPMCDSDVELTEAGIVEERERAERQARWDKEARDAEEAVPCFSCGALHKESELPELSGQYHCPDCHEGWVMMDSREQDDDDYIPVGDLEADLEALKQEFDSLIASEGETVVPMKCTNCEWTGDWCDTGNITNDEGESYDTCPECDSPVVDVEADDAK
jgi:Zn finger protein HypA/HybF involved in hydrogenase expression